MKCTKAATAAVVVAGDNNKNNKNDNNTNNNNDNNLRMFCKSRVAIFHYGALRICLGKCRDDLSSCLYKIFTQSAVK